MVEEFLKSQRKTYTLMMLLLISSIGTSIILMIFGQMIFGEILAIIILIISMAYIRKLLTKINQYKTRETYLAKLADSVSDSLITVTSDGKIARMNNGAMELLNYTDSRPDIVVFDMFEPSSKLLVETTFMSFVMNDDSSQMRELAANWQNIYMFNTNKKRFPVSITMSKMNYNGDTHVTLMLRDMTKEIERIFLLEEKARIIETASKQKTEFLANMSHEIRTPLTGIMGMVDLLERDLTNRNQVDKDITKYIGSVRLAGTNLSQVLNDVLDVSKMEAGKMEIRNITFSPYELISSIVDTYSGLAAAKGLDLTFEHSLIETDGIVSDPDRLRQIIVNLIGNAIKFTLVGGIKISAHIEKNAIDNNVLKINVQDTGIGISREHLDGIFEPFNQVDGTLQRSNIGTGLGLTIVKNLVDCIGGIITVKSRLNTGSTFSLSIPVDIEKVNEEIIRPFPVLKNQLKVLNVDDNPMNRDVLQNMLSSNGYEITIACDGAEAVEKAKKETFDIILMDIHMPMMNGIDALRAIRQNTMNINTPIIALTADVMTHRKEHFKLAGFAEVVDKPINWNNLYQAMEDAFNAK